MQHPLRFTSLAAIVLAAATTMNGVNASALKVRQSQPLFTACAAIDFGGPCETFTTAVNDQCVNFDSSLSLAVSSINILIGGAECELFAQADCGFGEGSFEFINSSPLGSNVAQPFPDLRDFNFNDQAVSFFCTADGI